MEERTVEQSAGRSLRRDRGVNVFWILSKMTKETETETEREEVLTVRTGRNLAPQF